VNFLPRLSRVQRLAVIFFVIVVTNWAASAFTGYSLIGGDLFTIILIVFLVLLGLTLIRPLIGKLFARH
jgi:hypothetical protein